MREAQLSQLRAKEAEAADKVRAANDRVVEGLNVERAALTSTERERFVAQALSRLSAEATAQQRREVEELAGALYDEQQALQARQRLMDEGRSVIDRTRTATEQYAAEIAKLNELLAAGAIDQQTYGRAVEEANDRALRSSQAWTDGATRFLKDYVAESQDAASATERAFGQAFSGAEDALTGFVTTGKLEIKGLADNQGRIPGDRAAAHHNIDVAALLEVGIRDRLAGPAPARLPLQQVDAMEGAGFPHQPPVAAILPVAAPAPRVEQAGFALDLHKALHPGLVVARKPVAAVPQVPAAALWRIARRSTVSRIPAAPPVSRVGTGRPAQLSCSPRRSASVIGRSRYCSSVRSPVTIITSAGMPAVRVTPAGRVARSTAIWAR